MTASMLRGAGIGGPEISPSAEGGPKGVGAMVPHSLRGAAGREGVPKGAPRSSLRTEIRAPMPTRAPPRPPERKGQARVPTAAE